MAREVRSAGNALAIELLGGEREVFDIMRWVLIALLMTGLLGAQMEERTRKVIDRTQMDLRSASDFETGRHHGKEAERYQNAERHLSDFDREYVRGKFDKDKLDTAIDDVKNVVEHNTLDPAARDALRSDLDALRDLRADYDRRHH